MSNEKLTKLKNGMLHYRYDCNPDIGFDFYTLAEVGGPYQPWFRDEIARLGWVVEYGRYLTHYPWVADFVIGCEP